MAVSSVDTLSGPYTTNGVTTTFPFTFKAMDEAEVRVFRIASTGIETTISSGAYDVTLTEDGGSVVFTSAPAAGDPLYIGTDPDFTQQITFENQGAFLPEVMNEAFDRAAIRDLAIKRDLDRSIRVPLGEESAVLPPIADRSLKYLAFDAGGLPIATDAVVDLIANEALGVDVGQNNMGTTPGTILSDNGTAKTWFEESEAAIEVAAEGALLAVKRTPELDDTKTGEIILEAKEYALPGNIVLDDAVVDAGEASFSGGDPLGAPILLDARRGAWTPQLQAGGSATGFAFSSRDGRVHAAKDFAFLQCTLTLSAMGGASGALVIAGLPTDIVPASRWPIGCQITSVSGVPAGTIHAVMDGGAIHLRRGLSNKAPRLMAADVRPDFSITLSVIFPRF